MNEKQLKSSVPFPHPELTLAEGVIAVGGQLDVGTLYHAYARGIFPWPQEGYPMLWFSPEKRGILDFKKFHVSESLMRFKRRHPEIEITLNRSFRQVVEECARQPRPGQDGTWILPAMRKAYEDFHTAGFALSLEVRVDQVLVGGIYGVLVRGVFSGESMFYKVPNASKLAFWALVEHLQQSGHSWMDIQMVTPVTEAFGGEYVSRAEFIDRLVRTQKQAGYETLF